MKTERELFLESVADKNWIGSNSIKNDYKFLDGKFIALKKDDEDYADWLNIGWEMWEASASREGYKLVPVEKVMDCLYQISDRSYVDDNVSEIKAMIGAVP